MSREGVERTVDLSIRLPGDGRSVAFIRHRIRNALQELGARAEDVADVELAVSEACTNVLEHAASPEHYRVSVVVRAGCCEVQVIDTGRGFDRRLVEEWVPGRDTERGRGLPLMRLVMDHVHLTSRPQRGTLVTLTKQLRFRPGAPGAGRGLLAASPDGGGPLPS